MSPLISVIVPIYKVEPYLRRCLDSIVNQTYRNLEIILVDDGSPDKCPVMCDVWAKKDSRIKVVHKENGGLSSARNAGLDICSGQYICFVDSDDYISPDMCAYLLKLCLDRDADIAQIDFLEVDSDNVQPKDRCEQLKQYEEKEALNYLMKITTELGTNFVVWTCLYRKDLVKELRFREGKIYEDIDYKVKAFKNCRRLIQSNLQKYFYRQVAGSISNRGIKANECDMVEAANLVCELTCDEDYGEIKKLGNLKAVRAPLTILCKLAYYGVADDIVDKNKIICQCTLAVRRNINILVNSSIPFSRKVLAVLFCMNYRVAEMIIGVGRWLKMI